MLGQTHQPGDLARAHDLVGNQDIVNTTFGHDLRFPQLGAGDANRTSSELFVSNDRGFVSLSMGAQFRRQSTKGSSHPGDIPLHDVEVQEQDRGIEFVNPRADEPSRKSHEEIPPRSSSKTKAGAEPPYGTTHLSTRRLFIVVACP